MKRDDVKAAADGLSRLEALERALDDVNKAPHDALPVSFYYHGNDGDSFRSDDGTKAYYPREKYIAVVNMLIGFERLRLSTLGVQL